MSTQLRLQIVTGGRKLLSCSFHFIFDYELLLLCFLKVRLLCGRATVLSRKLFHFQTAFLQPPFVFYVARMWRAKLIRHPGRLGEL